MQKEDPLLSNLSGMKEEQTVEKKKSSSRFALDDEDDDEYDAAEMERI